jgi:ubiquinol-cytochrome c reductase cytochrome c1 subunit
MMKKLIIAAAVVFAGLQAGAAQAAEGNALPARDWSFSGIFGHYDRGAMRRGFQVYREVCSGCHSLKMIAFRNLEALGYGEDEIKAIAAEYTVVDGPDDEGEMFERPGLPPDRIPSPFANAKAAAAANNGAAPPDLSLMTKARDGGADYVHALLTGYTDPPDGIELLDVQSYNLYFPGNVTAMAPPLSEDAVEYDDGTAATVEQMATDIVTFLTWAAEPEMEERKRMGIKVILFLLVFTAVLYAVKRKVWADLH